MPKSGQVTHIKQYISICVRARRWASFGNEAKCKSGGDFKIQAKKKNLNEINTRSVTSALVSKKGLY